MSKTPVDVRGLDISPLSLNSGPVVGNQQSGSRLGIWTDKAPGGKQGASSSSSSLHASHSTPNLQGQSHPQTLPHLFSDCNWCSVFQLYTLYSAHVFGNVK